jgi:hypothetical protein
VCVCVCVFHEEMMGVLKVIIRAEFLFTHLNFANGGGSETR